MENITYEALNEKYEECVKNLPMPDILPTKTAKELPQEFIGAIIKEADPISYEEMEKIYREATTSSNIQPDLSWTNLATMRFIWGDKQVDAWIEDGTIILEENSDAPTKL
jgi:hypothetical protein